MKHVTSTLWSANKSLAVLIGSVSLFIAVIWLALARITITPVVVVDVKPEKDGYISLSKNLTYISNPVFIRRTTDTYTVDQLTNTYDLQETDGVWRSVTPCPGLESETSVQVVCAPVPFMIFIREGVSRRLRRE